MKNGHLELSGAQLSTEYPVHRYVLGTIDGKTVLHFAPKNVFLNDAISDVRKRHGNGSFEILGVGIAMLEPGPYKASKVGRWLGAKDGTIRLRPDETGRKREPDTRLTSTIVKQHFPEYAVEVE